MRPSGYAPPLPVALGTAWTILGEGVIDEPSPLPTTSRRSCSLSDSNLINDVDNGEPRGMPYLRGARQTWERDE